MCLRNIFFSHPILQNSFCRAHELAEHLLVVLEPVEHLLPELKPAEHLLLTLGKGRTGSIRFADVLRELGL
jgi:hypothetical protein